RSTDYTSAFELVCRGRPRRPAFSRQHRSGVGKAERLAQQRNDLQWNGKMPCPARTVADVGILDIFEVTEDPPQQRGDLPSGQVIHAVRREQPIELDDLIRRARLLI